ncbi:adenylyl-sulfate kinase [Streptacidiphilus sp. N1-10]|uniref:Adenylyl-sulfate kinase n=1 Tax=Streptacidiphilus jeojiensis TaxID=3229225 RepID=A0ABV6XLJ7_9ACTN
MMQMRSKPCGCGVTVWLTGPSDVGTSALTQALAERLRGAGYRVAALSTDEAPARSVHRVGLTAEVLAHNGVIALVSSAAPDASARDAVRDRHRSSGTHFLEVHVEAPARTHDPIGADRRYEPPHHPDLVIPAQAQSSGEALVILARLLAAKSFVA